ncbi:MAG: hypothetical protein K8H86_07640 [Ignavibacteriaceae bacterium]|nr:hypothetical protein [Ignavibacteriaceae bacterium]
MNKIILKKIAATVAVVFSLLTIVEGSQVLFGITQPDYYVLKPLLVYNIIMGFVGIAVGVIIWINLTKALRFTLLVAAAHLTVLFIVLIIYISNSAVAAHSVNAMIIRSLIWFAVTITIWKTGKPEMLKSKNI